MSEQYPTQAECQEMLNELWVQDPDLYDYITSCEAEELPELEWKPIKLSQDEIDFMEHQKYIAWKIAGIFGLSLQDLWIVDGTIVVPVYTVGLSGKSEG